VGMAVVQLARAKGLKAVGVVSAGVTDYKGVQAALKAAGAEVVVEARAAGSAAFRKACAELKPKLAVHCSASRVEATAIARVLAPGGTLVAVAGAGPVTLPSSLLIDKGVKVSGFNLQAALGQDAAKTLKELADLVKAGKLKQTVAATEPLANFAEAISKAGRNPNGSILLKM
jgi:NADPH:quinone reductase-like Zn-dependent oxidoreductase